MARRPGIYIERELDGNYRVVHDRGNRQSIRIIVQKIKEKEDAERTKRLLLRSGSYG